MSRVRALRALALALCAHQSARRVAFVSAVWRLRARSPRLRAPPRQCVSLCKPALCSMVVAPFGCAFLRLRFFCSFAPFALALLGGCGPCARPFFLLSSLRLVRFCALVALLCAWFVSSNFDALVCPSCSSSCSVGSFCGAAGGRVSVPGTRRRRGWSTPTDSFAPLRVLPPVCVFASLRWRSFARAPPCACASLRQRVVGQQGCLLIIAALVLGGQGRLRLVIAAALCAPSGGAAPNSSFARISSDFPASCCARPGDRPQQCLLLTFQMFFAPVLSALEWSSKSTLVLVLWALFARIWRTLQERLHKRLFLVFEAFFVQFSVHARWRG